MNIDPTLRGADRIGNLLLGVGAAAYSVFAHFDHAWLRVLVGAVGLLLIFGALRGT
ncbi:MAG: hypothetical protein KC591_00090 [Gemmatimonadetes bacterium]|nr:hypothetical protein [Gemmatimonadota bacterium]